jgi:hypothetical protein
VDSADSLHRACIGLCFSISIYGYVPSCVEEMLTYSHGVLGLRRPHALGFAVTFAGRASCKLEGGGKKWV